LASVDARPGSSESDATNLRSASSKRAASNASTPATKSARARSKSALIGSSPA
jgi:hypothetical protein